MRYNLAEVMTRLIASAFATHVLLANFCMMPMAMAAEMPMRDMHTMEDVMTPMEPMSHADCPDCPHHQKQQEPAQQSSSCAGHCLAQAYQSITGIVFQGGQEVAVVPSLRNAFVEDNHNQEEKVPVAASPPPTMPTDTIVLSL